MSIETSTVTVYRLRGLPNSGWADITIDEGHNSGRISISSDWGNWANYWGACGESFKKFLCGLDIHYFAGKIGAGNWVDTEATLKSWKRYVLEQRREENIEADEAREAYDALKSLNDISYDALLYAAYENEFIGKVFQYELYTVTDVNPQFKAFWEKAYKPFIQHLKLELQ